MSDVGVVLSLPSVQDNVTAAREAEQAGFESVWTTEFPDRSAVVSLAAIAIATERVTLGTAIAYAFGRTPIVLAAEARDLDVLSGGRLILGLGTGTQRMQREWHGLDGEHPAPRMEELVPLLRRLLALEQTGLEHSGRFYRVNVRPTAPVVPPLRTDLPIYMAGVNVRMIEAVGTVADGLVGHPLFTPEYTRDVVRPALARGAERAGRDAPPPVAGYLTCVIDPDGEAARSLARGVVAFNSTVSTYRPVLSHHGFDAEADVVRAAWERRDFEGMAAAVSDDMLAAIAIAGTPDEVRTQFEQRRAGVFERTLLWSPLGGLDAVRATISAFGSEPPG
ncbi:MAG TPA: LLM class flavin-dependent oxidoreductase [Solirubrobacteraceae bacterium]|nr:LLM class flavin-dependent oxidoreductase [Solirubrobacteraceae bacterium]